MRVGVPAPSPAGSARKGGRVPRLLQTCLRKKDAERRQPVRGGLLPQEEKQGTPHSRVEGLSATRPCLPRREWGWGRLFSPCPPFPLSPFPSLAPHPRGGAAARGAPATGPPAAVAVVTAPANWPVKRAGGSCSGQEGQGRRPSWALSVQDWGTRRGQSALVRVGASYFSLLDWGLPVVDPFKKLPQ